LKCFYIGKTIDSEGSFLVQAHGRKQETLKNTLCVF